jgi:hypothetical protein
LISLLSKPISWINNAGSLTAAVGRVYRHNFQKQKGNGEALVLKLHE